jgi:hypothetical protein
MAVAFTRSTCEDGVEDCGLTPLMRQPEHATSARICPIFDQFDRTSCHLTGYGSLVASVINSRGQPCALIKMVGVKWEYIFLL